MLASFDTSGPGQKVLTSRDENEGTCRSGEGEEGPVFDPGPELQLGGSPRDILR